METNTKDSKDKKWTAVSLAWELGYVIAIPIVVFALLGRLLDKYLNSSPLFLLLGIFISLIISTIGVYIKAKRILK